MSDLMKFVKGAPFLWALVGVALLTGMDATVKALAGGFSTWQIVFIRFGFGALFVGIFAVAGRESWPSWTSWKTHFGRALLMALTATSFFYAVGKMPLAEVFVIVQTAPIFITIFARIFLKEQVGREIVFAIGAGFVGILIIVFGDINSGISFNHPPLALAAALVAPISYALAMVALRAQTARDPITVILTAQSLLVALMIAPIAFTQFIIPTGVDLWLFLGIAVLGTAGQLAYVHAIKRLKAAQFSVAEYSGLLWSVLFGYVFFAEIPRPAVWIGATLIIGSCLLILRQRRAPPGTPAQPSDV